MRAHGKRIGLTLLFGLGAALLASATFTSKPAPAGPPIALCSASDSLSPTGRQNAKISPSTRDPNVCVREKLGGIAGPTTPDCWSAAKVAGFTCVQVVDIN